MQMSPPWWCVSGAVLSKGGVALSEVAENDSRQNRNEKRHKINTKNINNSTIVSDNLEKSNHPGGPFSFLFYLPPILSASFSISHSFLDRKQNKKNKKKTGRRCSTQFLKPPAKAGEGLISSQSHVLVFIYFFFKSSHPPSPTPLTFISSRCYYITSRCFHPSIPPSILHLLLLQDLAAHLAAADFGALLASLHGLLHRGIDKLLAGLHGG